MEQEWILHFQKKHYTGNWKALLLRSPNGDTDNPFLIEDSPEKYQDTVFLKTAPFLQQVLQSFKCPLLSVRLLKLEAGARILEHKDADLSYESGQVRLHIPIQTHNKVQFLLQGEPVKLLAGECWYINVNLPHALANEGETDRVHLVIDAVVNDWVKELFAGANYEDVKITETADAYSREDQLEIIANLEALNLPSATALAEQMKQSAGLSGKR